MKTILTGQSRFDWRSMPESPVSAGGRYVSQDPGLIREIFSRVRADGS